MLSELLVIVFLEEVVTNLLCCIQRFARLIGLVGLSLELYMLYTHSRIADTESEILFVVAILSFTLQPLVLFPPVGSFLLHLNSDQC
jgi:hypothetical protein